MIATASASLLLRQDLTDMHQPERSREVLGWAMIVQRGECFLP